MRFAIVAAIVLTFSCPSPAQNKTLHQGRVQELGVKLRPNEWALENPACDGKGNVFVAAGNPAGDLPGDWPTLMFDSNGLLKAEFASSRKDLHLPVYEDVNEPAALRPDGGVARLAWSMHWLSMAAFSADGKLESRIKLDPPAFIPEQFAVFPSGELLVTGLEDVHTIRALGAFKSFTALYDKNGHLLKCCIFRKMLKLIPLRRLGTHDTLMVPCSVTGQFRAVRCDWETTGTSTSCVVHPRRPYT